MTKHQNIPGALDLSRRSFLVSVGAAGLVCGFGALPGATLGVGRRALRSHDLVQHRRPTGS